MSRTTVRDEGFLIHKWILTLKNNDESDECKEAELIRPMLENWGRLMNSSS